MFEHKQEKLLPRRKFARRMLISAGFAAAILAAALAAGTLGYHAFAGFTWIDAFLNASMILTGMGPVGELKTNSAKIFASFYALVSGVVFLSIIAVTMGPLVHRLLHRFHIDEGDLKTSDRGPRKP